jgi:hypothetical protein
VVKKKGNQGKHAGAQCLRERKFLALLLTEAALRKASREADSDHSSKGSDLTSEATP